MSKQCVLIIVKTKWYVQSLKTLEFFLLIVDADAYILHMILWIKISIEINTGEGK